MTIVITSDDRSRTINGREIALLPNVIRSIRQKTQYTNDEILVIDNGNLSQATLDFLSTVPHRRVTYTIEGKFNFAHKLNFSVRHAGDDQLVILNDDVEVISPGWLHALLEYGEDPAVGAVGAKLYFPNGRLQHVGVVLGVNGIAAHSFHQGRESPRLLRVHARAAQLLRGDGRVPHDAARRVRRNGRLQRSARH